MIATVRWCGRVLDFIEPLASVKTQNNTMHRRTACEVFQVDSPPSVLGDCRRYLKDHRNAGPWGNYVGR